MGLGLERGYLSHAEHAHRAASGRNPQGGQATATVTGTTPLTTVPPRLPSALQRHCFICYPNADTPTSWHSSTFPFLRQEERSHIYLQTHPDPAQDPAAPFVSRADPRDLQQHHADVHLPKRNLSCPQEDHRQAGGLKARSSQTPRGACPDLDWPGELRPPFVKSRMSTEECLALPSRTELQLERLIFTAHGRRNAQVSSGAGQVGESPGRGGGPAFLFFGRTTGCRKINLSAWLGPAIGLVLHKQSSTLWFCSITTTAGPFWGAHWLLQATLMREEYNSMRGKGRNLTPWACTSTAKSLLSLSSALIICFLWHL